MKTGDTIAAISVSLGALSMLGFLPAHDAHPAIPVLPRSHPAGLVAVAHAAPLRRLRVVAPVLPPTPQAHSIALKAHTNGLQAHTSPLLPIPTVVANPGVLLHAPSLSVAVITAELVSAGAPFAGQVWDGKPAPQYIYDAAVWWHLDPAVLLGFMHHESRYGRVGMAVQTHGPCNIRPLSGVGYVWYKTWQQGVDDCIRLLGRYGRDYGHNELGNAVNTWAPPSDGNSVTDYVVDVVQTMARLTRESQ